MPPTQPPGRLPGDLLQRLVQATVRAYDSEALQQLVRIHLGEDLGAITEGGNLQQVVFRLFSWAENHGRMAELVGALKKERPQKREIQQITTEVLTWLRGYP